MARHLRPTLLVAAAALVAGCGSTSAERPGAAAAVKQRAASAPVSGQLRVGLTDIGIGSASFGTAAGGLEILPNVRVPGTPNTQQGVGAGAGCDDVNLLPEKSNLSDIQASTLCLLNGERADAGLRPLKENDQLADAAESHSKAMVADQFFDHVGRNGSDPVSRVRKTGYIPKVGTWTVGENLAWGTGSLSTPKAIVAAWMKSQGHRENILRSSYKEIGLGIVAGNPRSRSGSGATFTTEFGAVSTPGSGRASSTKARKARVSKARRARASRARKARASKARASFKARIAAPNVYQRTNKRR